MVVQDIAPSGASGLSPADVTSTVQFVDLVLPDWNGIMRGKRIPSEDWPSVTSNGVALPASTLILGPDSRPPAFLQIGTQSGDPDIIFDPLLETLAMVPWGDGNRAQVLLAPSPKRAKRHSWDTRALAQALAKDVQDKGLSPVVAFELEFNLYEGRPVSKAPNSAPQSRPSDLPGENAHGEGVYRFDVLNDFWPVLEACRQACVSLGLPVGAVIVEAGHGQFEINLKHTRDVVAAADACVLMRQAVRETARKHNLAATFMAKPRLDTAGNGMHVHVSLLDQHGQNVLAGASPDGLSPLAMRLVSAMLELAPAATLLHAPNINSFRRFAATGDAYAPGADDGVHGVRCSWGVNDRRKAIRVPLSNEQNRRIEHRFAGADADPYLVLTSVLAGILHGLDLRPGSSDPTDALLPSTFQSACDAFEASHTLRSLLGDDLHHDYVQVKRDAFASFSNHIGMREYAWYF